jgi:hypothetical protein
MQRQDQDAFGGIPHLQPAANPPHPTVPDRL